MDSCSNQTKTHSGTFYVVFGRKGLISRSFRRKSLWSKLPEGNRRMLNVPFVEDKGDVLFDVTFPIVIFGSMLVVGLGRDLK
jgi:hypothetical protein